MENILVLQGVSKKFGQQQALSDVNLTIKKGDIYGLIGKNGAGKTTLIKIMTQLMHASSGTVSLFGSSNQAEWTQARKRVGSVIETPVAHNHLTAYENLSYYCKLRQIPNADKAIQETLNYVDLTDTGKKKFRDFSLGMKQRLGVAAAILGDPALVILDEPTNGLDPQAITQMRELIRSLRSEGRTVLLSSHILAEVEQVVDRVAIIANGDVVTESSLQDLRAQHSADGVTVIIRTDDDAALVPALRELPGVRDVQSLPDGGVRVRTDDDTAHGLAMELTRRGIGFTELTVEAATLETVFLELTAQQTGDPR